MNRRRFLATATGACAISLAGCSRVGVERIELRPVGQETESRETHLLFGQDGRELLTFTVRHPRGHVEDVDQIPLRVHVWHAADIHLDGFRIELRAPADGERPITDVYLASPWYDSGPSLDFYTGDDGRTTTLAADDLGGLGDGTLSLELVLEPAELPDALPVATSGVFGLSETGTLGRSYRAVGQTTVEIARERES